MTLIEIREYMMKVKMTTLGGLCHFFNADPTMVRCMLRHWIQKGKVRKCMKTKACGSKCFKCPTLSTEIYEWVDVPRQACV